MPPLACPPLEDLLRRAIARRRRRRIAAGILGAVTVSSLVVAGLEVARFLTKPVREPSYGHLDVLAAGALVAALVLGAAAVAAARAGNEERLARDLDRRLGLEDLVSTTLALVRGRVASPLGVHVVAAAARDLEAASPRLGTLVLPDAALERAARRTVPLAVIAWVLFLLFVAIDWLQGLRWPFGLLGTNANDVGVVPRPSDRVDRPIPAKDPGGPAGDEPAPDDEEAQAPPDEERPPEPASPAEEAPEAEVRVGVRPLRDPVRARDPVLVSVQATPTRDLPADREMELSLELDGHETPTRATMTLGSGATSGVGEIQDLRRLPAFADRLQAGEHRVRARLRDRATGATFESEPASFRVEPEEGAGGGGNSAPPPPPPAPAPTGGADAADPRPSPPTPPSPPSAAPDVPIGFDPQVVVPLFGEGEEVPKKGVTVVLVPGGGPEPDAVPRRADVAEELPAAERRAEAAVDRAGVRAEDRELLRRYFEALRRLAR